MALIKKQVFLRSRDENLQQFLAKASSKDSGYGAGNKGMDYKPDTANLDQRWGQPSSRDKANTKARSKALIRGVSEKEGDAAKKNPHPSTVSPPDPSGRDYPGEVHDRDDLPDQGWDNSNSAQKEFIIEGVRDAYLEKFFRRKPKTPEEKYEQEMERYERSKAQRDAFKRGAKKVGSKAKDAGRAVKRGVEETGVRNPLRNPFYRKRPKDSKKTAGGQPMSRAEKVERYGMDEYDAGEDGPYRVPQKKGPAPQGKKPSPGHEWDKASARWVPENMDAITRARQEAGSVTGRKKSNYESGPSTPEEQYQADKKKAVQSAVWDAWFEKQESHLTRGKDESDEEWWKRLKEEEDMKDEARWDEQAERDQAGDEKEMDEWADYEEDMRNQGPPDIDENQDESDAPSNVKKAIWDAWFEKQGTKWEDASQYLRDSKDTVEDREYQSRVALWRQGHPKGFAPPKWGESHEDWKARSNDPKNTEQKGAGRPGAGEGTPAWSQKRESPGEE